MRSVLLQPTGLYGAFPAGDLVGHVAREVGRDTGHGDLEQPRLVSIRACVTSFSLATISFGVPFGTKNAAQVVTSWSASSPGRRRGTTWRARAGVSIAPKRFQEVRR